MISKERKLFNRIEAHIRPDPSNHTIWRIDFDNLLRALGNQGLIIQPGKFEDRINTEMGRLIDKNIASTPVTRFVIAQIIYDIAMQMDLSNDLNVKNELGKRTQDIVTAQVADMPGEGPDSPFLKKD